MTHPSLSADRKEMAQSHRKDDIKSTSRTVNAFQISTNLANANTPQETLSRAKDIILCWVLDTFSLSAPAKADSASNDKASLEIVEIDDTNVWALRLEEKPTSMTNGQNIHEVEIIIKPGAVGMIYRLTVAKYNGPEHRAPRAIPSFIYEVANQIGLMDGGHIMNGAAWIIDNDAELEKFYTFLLNEERELPVYMVTETGRGAQTFNTLVDHEQLAYSCLGVAHVALMTYQMGYQWTQRVGKWLSAYLGTVRTYQPKTPINEENKHRHPLAMPERIAGWEHEELHGPVAFAKFLELQAMQASASPQNWREHFVPITTLKSKALAGEFEFSEETHWKEIEKRYLRKVALLEDRIGEMAQEALSREQENAKLKAENILFNSRTYQFERATQNRSAPAPETAQRSPSVDAIDDDITLIPQWTMEVLGNRVRLSDDAVIEVMGTHEAHFENIPLMKECLMLLAGDVRDALMRSEDLQKSKAVKDSLRTLGASIETIDEHELRNYEEDYTFCLADHEDFLVRWVFKRGDSRNEKKDLRIYFDFDINSQSVLIGHLPNYLFPDSGK